MSKIRFSRKYLSVPYGAFLILFVIIPLLLIVFYAFTKTVEANPHFTLGGEYYQFTFDNFKSFFGNISNINTFIISVLIGLGNTVIVYYLVIQLL